MRSPDYISMWRAVGVYGTPDEGLTAYEVAAPAFATAIGLIACDLAVHVLDSVPDRIADNPVARKLRRRAEALSDRLSTFDIGTGEPVG